MNQAQCSGIAQFMEDLASWVATVATITAACMTASNLGPRITGYGFAVFTVGSIAWLSLGLLTDQPALIWTNIVMTGLNLFGVWRWLGRQAKVEDGAMAGAAASRSTPGEAMFPISMLTSAAVAARDGEGGNCVDAMAGCRSGRLAYVVVTDGGLAGVGETMRRIPWTMARIEEDRLVVDLDRNGIEALDAIPREEWPAR